MNTYNIQILRECGHWEWVRMTDQEHTDYRIARLRRYSKGEDPNQPQGICTSCRRAEGDGEGMGMGMGKDD